jgi:hypothetical protein
MADSQIFIGKFKAKSIGFFEQKRMLKKLFEKLKSHKKIKVKL